MDVLLAPSDLGFDLALSAGDLVVDRGLTTAVTISLFSDGLAELDRSVPAMDQDRRGYWAERSGEGYGSRLWQRFRDKKTAANAAAAREDCERALSWLIQDGIAREARVTASYDSKGTLAIEAALGRGVSRRWASLWKETLALDFKAAGFTLRLVGS